MKTFLSKNLFLATIVFAIYSCSSFNHEYNDYIETSTEMAIDGKYDSIDIHALKIMNNVYTSNNDSANICTLNLIFGIINYNTLRLDSALFHLLKAEQFSNCKPELKPHIYYYLASAFIDYDPILAHDIIYSHQECSIDKYDYSRFLNINVTDIEKNTHNFNSIYYSTLIQRSLNIQKEQHNKEMHLYFIVIIVISVLLIIITISLLFIIRYKRKTVVLTDSIFHQKNNFHVLLTKYMELYRSKCDKGTVYDDANKFLSALHNRYESLSKSDIAIIWLILLSFSREDICSTLIIGKEYYHQRRTNISKTLKLGTTRNLDKDLKTFVPEFLANNNL